MGASIIGWFLAVIGLGAALWFYQKRTVLQSDLSRSQSFLTQTQAQLAELTCRLDTRHADAARAEALAEQEAERRKVAEQEVQSWQQRFSEMESRCQDARETVARLQTEISQQERHHAEKIRQLQQTGDAMMQSFERVAGKVFEHQRQLHRQNVNELMTPFAQQLEQFGRITREYQQNNLEQYGKLDGSLNVMLQQRQALAEETRALTQALTGGNNKTQGQWGELVLARALTLSGLRENQEYTLQAAFSHVGEHGTKRLIPDALVYLPDGSCVVIDAKVSLTAYARACVDDNPNRDADLKEHAASVRNHIAALAQKNYPAALDNAAGLTLMFMPVESAFQAALMTDPTLMETALRHNIFPVTPITLTAALRGVAAGWQYRRQSENAEQITNEAVKLLDKLHRLLESITALGENLDKTSAQYQNVLRHLEGRGNVLRRAQKLMDLGVRPTSENKKAAALAGMIDALPPSDASNEAA